MVEVRVVVKEHDNGTECAGVLRVRRSGDKPQREKRGHSPDRFNQSKHPNPPLPSRSILLGQALSS